MPPPIARNSWRDARSQRRGSELAIWPQPDSRRDRRLFAAAIERRTCLKRAPDSRGALFGKPQPSLAQGIHLLLAPGRLHHPSRSVPGTEKKMAQFVRHDESQQYARVAVMPLGRGLDRLEVGGRQITP